MKLQNLLHLVEETKVRIIVNGQGKTYVEGDATFMDTLMLRDDVLNSRIVSIEVRENVLWVWLEDDD